MSVTCYVGKFMYMNSASKVLHVVSTIQALQLKNLYAFLVSLLSTANPKTPPDTCIGTGASSATVRYHFVIPTINIQNRVSPQSMFLRKYE
jgi:hypothetical protein